MNEVISNFQATFFSLAISIIVASFMGLILLPIILKRLGVERRHRQVIARFTVGILFVIIFTIRLKTL